MKTQVTLSLALTLTSLCALPSLHAQRKAFDGTFTKVDAPESSYTIGSDTYTFGVGGTTGNEGNLFLDSFQVETGPSTSQTWALDPVLSATVRMQAPTNATNTGLQPWYSSNQNPSGSTTNYTFGPSQLTSWQDTLSGGIINRGADNPMVNAGNTSLDFERIDLVFDVGLRGTGSQLQNLGVLVNDRGANHAIGVVAITGIDSSGNANSFGSTVFQFSNPVNEYGVLWDGPTAEQAGSTNVILKPSSGGATDPFEPGYDTDNTQNVGGLLLTFDDLGITDDQLFYGWALIADDTAGYVNQYLIDNNITDAAAQAAAVTALLIDLEDTDVYPQNTAEGSVPSSLPSVAGANGLDPTALTGSLVYNTEVPDPRNGFVQPEPALAMAPLAFLLCLLNRRFARRLKPAGA